MQRHALSALILPLLSAASILIAQCPDPSPPPGGFNIAEVVTTVARSDGYLTTTVVRYPTDPAGPCGWPLIMVIHGGGGSQSVVASIARSLARVGYITAAYDVRGQGPSVALNPPNLMHDFVGLRELIDLFEAMESVEADFPTLTDIGRIGVTGYSQGGGHSLLAAQHSGRLPPANPWRNAQFPTVSAVVARDAAGDAGNAGPLQTFNDRTIERLFSTSGGITYRPGALATLRPLVLAEDFAGFEAATNVPGMDGTVLLPLCTVPVYLHASYDDKRINPSSVFASYSLLPANTPKRLMLGTGGHDSPVNAQDEALYARGRKDWFDRFLKLVPNGAAGSPIIRAAVTPDGIADYQNPDSLWDFRVQDTLPAPSVNTQTLYLAPGGGLSNIPVGGAVASTVFHSVPAAFDMNAYTTVQPSAALLPAIIPLSFVSFTSAPLLQDRVLQGIGSVTLRLTSTAPNFQAHAVLFDVGPGGSVRWVTSAAISSLGMAGLQTLSANFYLQSYTFREGHSLRLQIENLHIHRANTGNPAEIKSVPYFDSTVIQVIAGGGIIGSSMSLPLLPMPGPRLTTNLLQQSVALPVNQRQTVHTDSSHAGFPAITVPSFAGTSPGTLVGGLLVPLNFDALSFAVLANPALPPFVNLLGVLDARGSADSGINLGGAPLPPAFIGLELSMVTGIVGPTLEVSNPITITFIP